jgi:hypothetical protein
VFSRGSGSDTVMMSWMYPVVWLYFIVIDSDKSLVNTVLNFCSGHVGQAVHQEFVDANEGLFAVGNDTMMLKEFVVLIVEDRFSLSVIFFSSFSFETIFVENSRLIEDMTDSCLPALPGR